MRGVDDLIGDLDIEAYIDSAYEQLLDNASVECAHLGDAAFAAQHDARAAEDWSELKAAMLAEHALRLPRSVAIQMGGAGAAPLAAQGGAAALLPGTQAPAMTKHLMAYAQECVLPHNVQRLKHGAPVACPAADYGRVARDSLAANLFSEVPEVRSFRVHITSSIGVRALAHRPWLVYHFSFFLM